MMLQNDLEPVIRIRRGRRWFADTIAVVGLMLVVGVASAVPFNVTVDTTSLSGTAKLAFDLTDGDFAVSNSVTITNFAISGATLGSVDALLTSSVGITGFLPSAVTLAEDISTTPISLVQDLSFSGVASSISFTFDLSVNSNLGGPFDTFAFSLLDDAGAYLISTDLFVDGLLVLVYIDGTPTGTRQVAQTTQPSVPVTVTQQAAIPEPGTLVLSLVGLGALGWRKKTRLRGVPKGLLITVPPFSLRRT